MNKYFIKISTDLEWMEVPKEEYVRIERNAGFHNTMDRPDEPATAAFRGITGVEGKIEYDINDAGPEWVRKSI